ncbi:NAD(P)H-dependent oxidoreductase [Streptomyces massasporeus]|uniref:NAD(P)H-dependent oxidoreductase n=1 Tax=Streptomyces massasporeus TaxID=67324 RepID=UPI0037FDECF0
MATLLHIDTSLNGDSSHSREVTAAFRRARESENRQSSVIYRDLDADPLPHLRAPPTTPATPVRPTSPPRSGRPSRSAPN